MSTKGRSLGDQLFGFGGVPRPWFALVVAVLLTMVLLLAAFAHGLLGAGKVRVLWRLGLEPAVIVFILLIHPLLQRRWMLTIDALRPLAAQPELVERAFAVDRRLEWTALLLGSAFAIWVTHATTIAERWLSAYYLVTSIVMFGLMALSIYDGLLRTRLLTRIVRSGLKLDLFDRQLLTPLARWGQSVSLTFVGGTCLSLLFQSYDSLYSVEALVIYSILIVVALTLFLVSIWSIHVALVAAQARELAIVRKHWNGARNVLRRELPEAGTDVAARLYDPLVVFATYERQVMDASTWPFNPKIVKEVVASLVAPILIYGLKIALGLPGST